MVYEYYSPIMPIGGTSFAFYCIEDSEQSIEIWTKTVDNPSNLDGESNRGTGSICYIALDIFL